MKNIKIFLAFLHDLLAIIFSLFLAYALRFNFDVFILLVCIEGYGVLLALLILKES